MKGEGEKAESQQLACRRKAHEGRDMEEERAQLTSNPRREAEVLRAESGLEESIRPGKAMRKHVRG